MAMKERIDIANSGLREFFPHFSNHQRSQVMKLQCQCGRVLNTIRVTDTFTIDLIVSCSSERRATDETRRPFINIGIEIGLLT